MPGFSDHLSWHADKSWMIAPGIALWIAPWTALLIAPWMIPRTTAHQRVTVYLYFLLNLAKKPAQESVEDV